MGLLRRARYLCFRGQKPLFLNLLHFSCHSWIIEFKAYVPHPRFQDAGDGKLPFRSRNSAQPPADCHDCEYNERMDTVNPILKEHIIQAIRNQIRDKDPPETKETYERL